MSIRVADGQMIITRPGGGTLFNIDDKLLHITDALSGTLSIPAKSLGGGSNSGINFVNETTNYDLGPVGAGASQIIGAVKFILTTGTGGLAYNRWHMLMGGSIVWLQDGAPSITSLGGGSNYNCAQMVTYHFEIASGRARMVRRFVGNTAFGYEVRAHNIQYKLRCGAWV